MTTLQQRSGPRPGVSRRMPHTQLDQQPDPGGVVTELARRIFDRLPDGVQIAPSGISVPGARALVLDDDTPTGPPEAFLVGREFAHLHPVPDSSLHLTLTPAVATGQVPPTVVMVYAPRTVAEIDVVADLVYRSHRFASTPVTTITNREGR